MKEKVVLVITSTFPRFKNDPLNSYIFDLHQGIAREYKTIILAPHEHGLAFKDKIGNLEVFRFPYFLPFSLEKLAYGQGILANLKKNFLLFFEIPFFIFCETVWAIFLVLKYQVSLIHIHWFIPQIFSALIIKCCLKIPFISSLHGSDIAKFRRFNFVLKFSDQITVNSHATYNLLSSKLKKKTQIIPMGVDFIKFKKINFNPLKREYNNFPILLSIGRLVKQKGHKYLIEATKLLKTDFPNILLIIIGKGQKEELQKIIDQDDLQNNCVVLGETSQEKLVDYYNLATIYLAYPCDFEGLGLTLIEAAACQTVIIGADIGGIRDIIKNKSNGLVVKLQDIRALVKAIELLINNEKMKNKFIKKAYSDLNKKYSWPIISQAFENLYNQLYASRN